MPSEKGSEQPPHITIPEAVDDGVQHRRDHSVRDAGHSAPLGLRPGHGLEVDCSDCPVEEAHHGQVGATGGQLEHHSCDGPLGGEDE